MPSPHSKSSKVRPPSPNKVILAEPLNPDKNIDVELSNAGYTPITKILIQSSDSNRIKYIKTYNTHGKLVYVYLDCDGNCSDMDCVQMSEVTEGLNVPYTLRTTAASCNNLDISGIAFECGEGICALHRKRNNPMDFDEYLFTPEDHQHTDIMYTKGMAMPYPIVRLSEIRSNPDLITASIDESFINMRNTFFDLSNKEVNETISLLNKLEVESRNFLITARNVISQLNSDIQVLEKMAAEHRTAKNPTAEMKKNYRLILVNLRKRHEYLEEYIRYTDYFSRSQGALSTVVDDISKINAKISNISKNLGKVLPE